MATPKINLLAEATPGCTWLEVTLDLKAAEFRVGDVPRLRQVLARFHGLEDDQIRTVSIARWRPIVLLEMPRSSAHRTIEAFEKLSGDLLEALDELPFQSVRLDADIARRVAASEAAGVVLFRRLWKRLSSSLPKALTLDSILRAGHRGSRLFATAMLWLVTILAASCVALAGLVISAIQHLWSRVEGRLAMDPNDLARWKADARKLVALGLRVPTEGFGPARCELLTTEVQHVFAMRRAIAWTWSDWKVLLRAGLRTLVVVAAASFAATAVMLRWLYRHAVKWARRGRQEIAVLVELTQDWVHQDTINSRPHKSRSQRRAEKKRQTNLLGMDSDDVLFLQILGTLFLLVALILGAV